MDLIQWFLEKDSNFQRKFKAKSTIYWAHRDLSLAHTKELSKKLWILITGWIVIPFISFILFTWFKIWITRDLWNLFTSDITLRTLSDATVGVFLLGILILVLYTLFYNMYTLIMECDLSYYYRGLRVHIGESLDKSKFKTEERLKKEWEIE